MRFPFLALSLLFGAAACSGGNPSPLPGGAAHPPQSSGVLGRLVIKVPPKNRSPHRSRYVSPATASLAYSIDGVAKTPVVIGTSNPNCAVVGQNYLQCIITFSLAPGRHTFSFTAKDASGEPLSGNTNYAFTVKRGVANDLTVTLGGIAASIVVIPEKSLAVSGSQYSGFTIVGNSPQKFDIVAMDIDHDLIVGPGAPYPFVAATPSSMTVQPAASTAPNRVTLTSTYTTASDPTQPHASSLIVTATPVPNSGGTTVSTTIPLTLFQPWIYVADDVSGEILAYDEKGNQKTLPHPITGLGSAYGLVYDGHNGVLYATSYDQRAVKAFRPDGSPYALGAVAPFAGLSGPSGIEFDLLNDDIYVVNYAGTGSVAAFDEQGNAQTLSGTFAGVSDSYAVTYDPNQDWFYIANCSPGSAGAINAFTPQGNAQTLTGNGGAPFPNLLNPSGTAYDSSNERVYVNNYKYPFAYGNIVAYDSQGNQQTLPGNPDMIPTGWGIAYDPYDGFLYAAVDGYLNSAPLIMPTVWVYGEDGTKQATAGSFPNLAYPSGIAAVP